MLINKTENHLNATKLQKKEYYLRNKEILKAKHKEYRLKNKEKRNEYNRLYNKLYPEKSAEKTSKRRALLKNAVHADSNKQIIDHFYKMSVRLTNCLGIKFHVDHIIPISKGGFHHESNLQVIPASLNLLKSSKINYSLPNY